MKATSRRYILWMFFVMGPIMALGQASTKPSFCTEFSSCASPTGSQTLHAQSTGLPANTTAVTHKWYAASSGGSAIWTTSAYFPDPNVHSAMTSDLTFTPGPGVPSTYWVSATYTVNGTTWSESSARTRAGWTQIPPGNISISPSRSPLMCIGDNITLTPTGGSGYSWTSTPSGASGSGAITVSPPVQTTYVLHGTESTCGTQVTSSIVVSVGAKASPVTVPAGPTSWCQANSVFTSYTADAGPNASSYSWWVIPSTAATSNGSGGFTWSNTFSGTAVIHVQAFSQGSCNYASENTNTVTVYPTIGPATVTSPITVNYNTSTTLTASGAVSPEVYRWYDSFNNLISTGLTYTTPALQVAGPVTYYVTRYNPTTGCETPYANRATIVINIFMPPPAPPNATSNTCGDKILTFGTAPAGVTWYIQSSPTGTSTVVPIDFSTMSVGTTGTFYVRGRGNVSGTWSTAITVSNIIDPVDITLTAYDPTTTLVQATHGITLSPGFYVPAGSAFAAKIAITSECNDYMNWDETITYSLDGLVTASDSRTYLDGFGDGIQTLTKDFETKKLMGIQSLFNTYGAVVGSTLPAPILENDFLYKKAFASDAGGNRYAADDFDQRLTTGMTNPGEVNNPNPFGTQPGTPGWYYSTSNNLEPQTPVTQYPYARTFIPDGPDPTTSASSRPGDALRMGTNHEAKSQRIALLSTDTDLDHYYSLRPLFIPSPLPGTSLVNITTDMTMQFTTSGSSALASGGYVGITATSAGSPGAYIGGDITVTANTKYVLSVRGYVPTGKPQPSLKVNVFGGGANIVWPGPSMPLTNNAWTSVIFTVPSGVAKINAGVFYNGNAVANDSKFYVSAMEIHEAIPAQKGYKYISTDPDQKQSVSFVDADGKAIASAAVVSGVYDYWNYTYYNDAGQVVATVAPNDVNKTVFTKPQSSYDKYDHLGHVIESFSPDEGTTQYVYNSNGQIRFSQNQIQRDAIPKRFSYSNYDYLGRDIESGEYTGGGTNPYVFEPETTSSPSTYSVLNILENTGFTGVSRILDNVRCTDYTYITYDVAGSGAPATQQLFTGAVSKTENFNASTWYSYDEFGNVAWTIQSNAGFSNKRIDYTYDPFGNVTQVAYQAGQSDAFYHHYEYDADGRLINVYTSFDGSTKTIRAKYYYYIHGLLKRVELLNGTKKIQGIDYVYNIDGSLKAINHSDPLFDPGNDGNSSGFPTDVFGMALDYYSGDYSGAGLTTLGSLSVTGSSDNYSGLIKAQRWHSAVDGHGKTAYAYNYNPVNQLSSANWGAVSGSAGSYSFSAASPQSYRESIGSYDKNGNIMSLTRNGKGANVLGNYAYNYTPNTNKLASVTGGTNTVSYSYNSIGQMTQQVEGTNTMNVYYEAHGLVRYVRDASNNLIETYYYGDRGDVVKRALYGAGGTLAKMVWYIRDIMGNPLAIYETVGSNTNLVEQPIYGIGRIGSMKIKSGAQKYFYEVADHLGNVRAVIGDPTTDAPVATYETSSQTAERGNFLRYDNARRVSSYLFNHTGGGGLFAERLNGSANEKYGVARSLSVMPGDTVKLEVYAKYVDTNSANWTTALNTLMGQIAAQTSGVVVDGTGYSSSTSSFTLGGLVNTSGSTGGPKAYLNWLIFDRNYALVNGGYVRLSSTPKEYGQNVAHEKLSTSFTVNEPSYVYTYLSNEEPTGSPIDVYFDDFKVTQVHGNIVAGGDYYPFGLPMDTRQMSYENYRYGYQGQFAEKDSLANWNAFQLRMYDARFGRWISPDPLGQFTSPYLAMGNDPTNATDPDGAWCCGGGGSAIEMGLKVPLGTLGAAEEMATITLQEVVVQASRITTPSALAAFSATLPQVNPANFKANSLASMPGGLPTIYAGGQTDPESFNLFEIGESYYTTVLYGEQFMHVEYSVFPRVARSKWTASVFFPSLSIRVKNTIIDQGSVRRKLAKAFDAARKSTYNNIKAISGNPERANNYFLTRLKIAIRSEFKYRGAEAYNRPTDGVEINFLRLKWGILGIK
jgi:RHS repeat-associated protein